MVVARLREQNSAYGLLISLSGFARLRERQSSAGHYREDYPLNRYYWQEQVLPVPDPSRQLAESIDIPAAGARFLLSRSIHTAEAATDYLYARNLQTHDPFAFRRMERAVDAVRTAIENEEKILVHGDYDVDGISGTAILYLYLSGLVSEVYRFLPDRKKDGYGLADRAVEWACASGVGLVITVDCGVSDGELVRKLERAGIDVIICDHHEFPLAEDVSGIVLNPLADDYPFNALAGAGVAFKLVQALEQRSICGSVKPEELLDLVALATVGDMVPLIDENRYFVRKGLELMNLNMRTGLFALQKQAGLIKKEIDANAISYRLAPRLNAPGRISNPRPSLELLCSSDPLESDRLARLLEDENNRRKDMTELVHRSVMEKLAVLGDPRARGGIVLSDGEWEEGILGIAASRVVETFGRPALLISTRSRLAKGSGRSVAGIHLKEQLDLCGDLLLRYGGHAQAVGVTIEPSLVDSFIEKFSSQLDAVAGALPERPVLNIDAGISFKECSMELLDFLALCQPFGSGNPEAVFAISRLTVQSASRVGGGNHLKLRFRDGDGLDGEAIFFNSGEIGPAEVQNGPIDMAVTLMRGYYLNRYYPELRVVDIRSHREQPEPG
jgi:single-stranded-DNA-specific exonuclease